MHYKLLFLIFSVAQAFITRRAVNGKSRPLALLRLLTITFVFFITATYTALCQVAANQKTSTQLIKKRIEGDPLKNLPKNIEVLTYFGERADISSDNTRCF